MECEKDIGSTQNGHIQHLFNLQLITIKLAKLNLIINTKVVCICRYEIYFDTTENRKIETEQIRD